MSMLSETLLEQESLLQFDSFSNEDALTLGNYVIAIMRESHPGKGVAICVERSHMPLFTYVMAGAEANNLAWIQRKKRVTDLYGHSSMYIGENSRERGKPISAILPPADYQSEGGCFPIFLRGTGMVGTLTVSGLVSAEDHDVCVKALQKLLEFHAVST